MKTIQVDLSLISKYRAQLMGIATLGILFCHCPAHVAMPKMLAYAMFIGQTGNALFMWLSGFGLFYSLSSFYERNESITKWYKKRYLRILVPYLIIFLFPGFILAICNSDTDWLRLLSRLTLISYWKYHDCAWFLAVLIPLYAISPLIYRFLLWRNKVWQNAALMALPLTLIPVLQTGEVVVDTIIHHLPDAMAFIIGMVSAFYAKKQTSVNVLWFILGGVICVSLFFLQHRNYSTWYLGLNFFILPMLLLIIKRYDIKWNWLLWLGTISLESYLTNTTLPSYVKMIPWHHLSIDINFGNYLGYGIVIIGGLIWAYLIHKLSAVIIKII